MAKDLAKWAKDKGVKYFMVSYTDLFGGQRAKLVPTQAINDIAESNQVEALLKYEDGIVRALEDVENTLVALRDERQRAELLQSASASAEAALGRAQSLYDRGQIDLLPLLDAQRTRLTVRVSANDSQTQLLLDSVQLYKALGGGWQVFEPANQPAASASPSPKS